MRIWWCCKKSSLAIKKVTNIFKFDVNKHPFLRRNLPTCKTQNFSTTLLQELPKKQLNKSGQVIIRDEKITICLIFENKKISTLITINWIDFWDSSRNSSSLGMKIWWGSKRTAHWPLTKQRIFLYLKLVWQRSC